jgi:hypothetical protein
MAWSEFREKEMHLLNWQTIYMMKSVGGLGVVDLIMFNQVNVFENG